jgi:hypothetical protein
MRFGDISDDFLGEFVRHEPWIALAAAFAVGYLAARHDPARVELDTVINMPPVKSSDQNGNPIAQLSKSIRERPLTALAIGVTAGFVMGGGMRTRLGIAMLTFAAKTSAREAIVGFIGKATADYERAGRNPQD